MGLSTMEPHAQREGSRSEIEAQVAALVGVLDEDVRHVEATLTRLDTLRSLLIKRDDAALEKLLGEIRREGETYAATERRRQEVRRELAAGLGCGQDDLTLSKLLPRLSRENRAVVAERQTRLKALIGRLKREHALTTLLIADCAKFNRSLLQVFFGPAGKAGTMYSPAGVAKQPTGMALLNMQF